MYIELRDILRKTLLSVSLIGKYETYDKKEETKNILVKENSNQSKNIYENKEFEDIKVIEKNYERPIDSFMSFNDIIKSENNTEKDKEYIYEKKSIANINELDNIEVYDIDNLKDIHDKNDKKRKELAKIGYEMISEKIIEFTEWLDSIKIDPTIESLNDKCLEIREDTLEYIYRKTNLNNRDKKIIDKMLTSALKRLIREPIINLKQTKDKGKREEYIKLVEELFEL